MSDDPEQLDVVEELRGQLGWQIIPVLLLTVGILYVLAGQFEEIQKPVEALADARVEGLPLAVGLMAVNTALAGWRFQLVLKAVGHRISVPRSVEVLLAVWPVALIAPSRSNDLLRALVLRDEVPMLGCAGSVVAERLIDIQTLSLFGMIGCAAIGEWSWFALPAALWVGEWTAIAILVLAFDRVVQWPVVNRFESKLRSLFHAFDALRSRPRFLAGLVGVSILCWLAAFANIWLLLWIFNAPLSFGVVLGLWPLAIFVGVLPLTVGGMGTRDAAFAGLLTATGWAQLESGILAATVSYGVVTFMLPATLGIPLMIKNFWLDERKSGDDSS